MLKDKGRWAGLRLGLMAGALALAATMGNQALAGSPKPTLSTPTITCGDATQVSIDVKVCAGATGAPAGFSIQWMSAADYAANGNQWYLSEDPRLCKASLSGVPGSSNYNLAPLQCVTVNVGDNLFDTVGASSNCANKPLVCETDYVFRAFAHANGTSNRSAFTTNLTCTTDDCGQQTNCTYTQGYWKTHGPIPTGNNVNEWPVTSLTLGMVVYTDLQLQSIFNTPAGGNGLIALAHQLIAAKLNVANGADDSAVAVTIAAADALIGNLVVPPVGSGYLAPNVTSALVEALTNFNEGRTGPGHCAD